MKDLKGKKTSVGSGLRQAPPAKFKVAVRQRTEIYSPAEHTTLVYERGHVFDKPWKELIIRAKADTKNRILALIEIPTKQEEIKNDE